MSDNISNVFWFKLKPCPFCGSEAEFYHGDRRIVGHNESDDEVGIRCKNCDVGYGIRNYAEYKIEEREMEAYKLWNSRV